jgi:hypothetical protein
VEGNVNRIKMIKRQMYGRANFDLLPQTHPPCRLTSTGSTSITKNGPEPLWVDTAIASLGDGVECDDPRRGGFDRRQIARHTIRS